MAQQRAGLMTMIARGARRRCPRCGAGEVCESWFKMRERCPTCGLQFEGPPEEGFFLGAFTVNLIVTFGVLLLFVFAYIVMVAAGDAPELTSYVLVAATSCVVVPIAFYPFARSIWVAFELALHNMDEALGRRPGRAPAARDEPTGEEP